MRLTYSWISCAVVSLLQWNLACDIPMILAIKCIHNLPPHLSYVSTLPDITQKLKHDINKVKHWYLGPYSSGHHRVANSCVQALRQRDITSNTYYDLATQPALFGATYTPNRLFSEPLRHNHSHYWQEDNITFRFLCNVTVGVQGDICLKFLTHARSCLCHWSMALSMMPWGIQLQVSMLQLFSVVFQFLCNVRYCTNITKVRWQIMFAFNSWGRQDIISQAKFHCNRLTTVQDIKDYRSLIFWHML